MSVLLHVYPVDDLIEHDRSAETGEECVCGPHTEPVETEVGSVSWVVVHEALDGRP